MKKGFTLIELLIVVAIIGILAGVGIPMYNGYMVEAKISASKANHATITNFISATMTRCNLGASKVMLPGYKNIYCAWNANNIATEMVIYLRDYANFINPYWPDGSYGGVFSTNNSFPIIGASNISAIDNNIHSKQKKIFIYTNIGDGKGGNVYLRTEVYKE
jgi:type IV pilus assembly protein PilA